MEDAMPQNKYNVFEDSEHNTPIFELTKAKHVNKSKLKLSSTYRLESLCNEQDNSLERVSNHSRDNKLSSFNSKYQYNS